MRLFKTGPKPATPGRWYGSYHAAWSAAHPHACGAGSFYLHDVWGTSTPEFDKEWFEAAGMAMPTRVRVTDSLVVQGDPGFQFAKLTPVDETARRSARRYRSIYPDNFTPESEWP